MNRERIAVFLTLVIMAGLFLRCGGIIPKPITWRQTKVAEGLGAGESQAPGEHAIQILPQTPHSLPETVVRFSSDGSLIATGSEDRTVRIWDTATGLLRGVLTADGIGKITDLVFHPENLWVAVASAGPLSLSLWDPYTRKLITENRDRRWMKLAVSPRGDMLAAGSEDPPLGLWRVSDGTLRAVESTRTTKTGPDGCLRFTPDGERLVVVDGSSIDVLTSPSWSSQKLRRTALATDVCVIHPTGNSVFKGGTPYDQRPTRLHADNDLYGTWTVRERPEADLEPDWHQPYLRMESQTLKARSAAFSPDGTVVAISREGEREKPVLELRDARNGTLLRTLSIQASAVLAFHPNGRWIATTSAGSPRFWEVSDGTPIPRFPELRVRKIKAVAAHGPSRTLAVQDANSVVLWDVSTLRRKTIVQRGTRDGRGWGDYSDAVAFTPDGNFLAASGELWDLATGKPLGERIGAVNRVTLDGRFLAFDSRYGPALYDLRRREVVYNRRDANGYGEVQDLAFHPTLPLLITADNGGSLRFWDLDPGFGSAMGRLFSGADDGRIERPWTGGQPRNILTVDPRGRWFATSDNAQGDIPNSMRIWSLADRTMSEILVDTPPSRATALCVDETGDVIASGHADGLVRVWDRTRNVLAARFSGHHAQVRSCSFLPGSGILVTGSEDGTVGLWNWQERGAVVFLVASDEDWLAYTPDGFFDASRNGGRLVSVLMGKELFAIDQFALTKNRPDVLLSRLGLGDPEVLAHFLAQHKRRLRKANLPEEGEVGAKAPIMRVLDSRQQDRNLVLTYEAVDSDTDLQRLHLFVNDVRLFGSDGRPLAGRKARGELTVPLTKGLNKVELSAINASGVESLRALTQATIAGSESGDLYFLGFGVSLYKDAGLNLEFAHQDVLDLKAAFERQTGNFKTVHAWAFINEQVTADSIRKAKEMLVRGKPEDTLVLFIAGHGVHNRGPDARYYYLTHDANVDDLEHTAAPFELVEDLLQGIPHRKKLFLMDTCESGELDEQSEERYSVAANSRGLNHRGLRFKKLNKTVTTKGPRSSRAYLLQRDRYIYNDLFRRSGAIVFSSSRGGELSYERKELANGLFTEEFLRGLLEQRADANHDGTITEAELRAYVTGAVAELSGGLQHPTVDRDNLAIDISFKVAAKGK